MGGRSEDEQTLIRIQREWAEARVKGDSSYARRVEANDCTIVWPDGSIVNKQQDLQTMTGDVVFTEFKSMIFAYACVATLVSSLVREQSGRRRESKILSAENSCGPTHL
jgi:hypothetical protein